jgi:hypothetical protein
LRNPTVLAQEICVEEWRLFGEELTDIAKNVVVMRWSRSSVFSLFTFDRQTDDKLRVAGFRGEPDRASVLVDDTLHDAKSDSCSHADGLGRVEGIEDLRLTL